MAPRKDGYESDSEYESALEDQEEVKRVAKSLMRRSSELSPEGREIIGDFAAEVLGSTGMYQIPSNQPIYDVPRNRNSSMSRDDTPPPLPSSSPPSTLSRRHSSDSGISLETGNDFQQCSSSGLRRLSSDSISESEMSNAVNQAVEVVSSPEGQKKLKSKIENDPSFVKEQLTKFNNLSNKDKSLFGLSMFGIAIGVPLTIVALPILATIAAVAGLAVAIIGGLKLATPSKAEFKKTGQEIKHGVKNISDEVLTLQKKDSNIKKLFYDSDITQEHRDFIREYIVKNDGSKDQLKVDDNKIEAFKKAVLIEKPNIDNKKISSEIDRLAEKGKSTSGSDYEKLKESVNKIISTMGQDVLKNQEMKEMFKGELNEIKQTKATEKAAEKKGSFASKFSFSKQSSSYTENVEAERRGSSSNQGRST